MAAMTLREELIEKIARLPEAQLEWIASAIRQADQVPPRHSLAETLERANALYEKIAREAQGPVPDVVDLLQEAREERLNDIMGLP